MNSFARSMPWALALTSALAFAAPPDINDTMRQGYDRPVQTGPGATGDMRPGEQQNVGKEGTAIKEGPQGKTTLTKADQEFAKDVTKANNAEIKLSRLAATKATNPEVKKFAQMMLDDHGANLGELKDIADRKNFTLPVEEVSDAAQKAYDKLTDLSAEKFDREYTRIMVEDHKKAVKLFEKHSRSDAKNELKDFAAKALPTIQHHLDAAQTLERDLKGRM